MKKLNNIKKICVFGCFGNVADKRKMLQHLGKYNGLLIDTEK